MANTTKEIIDEIQLIKPTASFTKSDAEKVYAQAYTLFQRGKYQDAAHMFRMLIFANFLEPKFSLGLAACYHMLKDYKNAIRIYLDCTTKDPLNPKTAFYLSDCYIKTGDIISAMVALELAVVRAGNDPKFQVLKDRAQLTLNGLREQFKKEK